MPNTDVAPVKPEIRKRIMKKEFITEWSESGVIVVDRLTFAQDQFFEVVGEKKGMSLRHMYHPDSIPFRELHFLRGKKTKITIEILE